MNDDDEDGIWEPDDNDELWGRANLQAGDNHSDFHLSNSSDVTYNPSSGFEGMMDSNERNERVIVGLPTAIVNREPHPPMGFGLDETSRPVQRSGLIRRSWDGFSRRVCAMR